MAMADWVIKRYMTINDFQIDNPDTTAAVYAQISIDMNTNTMHLVMQDGDIPTAMTNNVVK